MRSLVPGVLTVTCLLGVARVDADSLDDLLGPREIAVGEAMRGGATGATAITLNPAGAPLNRELVFEGGYAYRADDSASLINASACDSTTAMPGCFFYAYAGASPELDGMTGSRRTHVVGTTLSRVLVPRVLVGGTAKYHDFNTDMAGETSTSGFSFDLGATLRLTQMINFGVSGQNLFATEDSSQFPRALGGGLLARPLEALSLGFDMRWKLDGDQSGARYGGGAELFLRGGKNGFPIRVGGLRDNSIGNGVTYVSAGLGFASMKWGIDLAGRRQIKGGDDMILMASMRFYGPRDAAPVLE